MQKLAEAFDSGKRHQGVTMDSKNCQETKVMSNGTESAGYTASAPTIGKKSPPRLANTDHCSRCLVTVYPLEKVGPFYGRVYHRECLQCAVCGGMLTVKTVYQNQKSVTDKEVYCRSHQPK